MQTYLRKEVFYRKLISESRTHRPNEITSWTRFMFPKTEAQLNEIKNFFVETGLAEKVCPNCPGRKINVSWLNKNQTNEQNEMIYARLRYKCGKCQKESSLNFLPKIYTIRTNINERQMLYIFHRIPFDSVQDIATKTRLSTTTIED